MMSLDRPRLALIVAAIVTTAVWGYALRPVSPALTVTFLDVGEGLCTVVRTPAGKVMVVDCGTSSWRKSDTIGEKLVAPYLQSMGVDWIDVAVLSHPHSDHISGYAGLLRLKPPKLVLDLGAKHASPHYRAFLTEVKRSGAKYRTARSGQSIEMGDGVVVQVLSPDPAGLYSDLNNRSIVLRVVYGEVAILLAADAEGEAEERMLDSRAEVRSDVLQVGHHGAAAGTTPRWLGSVEPRIAVISCGHRNQYGHPSAEVLGRLEASGARIYRTDRHGAVSITTDGRTLKARTFAASR